jgi:hypothetical protein
MFNAQLITSLMKGMQPIASHVLSLTPGQVLMGEVTKILPDQSATVRFGSMQVHAKLDAALEIGRKSWFQVQPISNPITLKLIPVQPQRQQASEDSLGSLLRFLGLKNGKQEEQLVRFFLQEKLPLTKPILQKGLELLQQMGKPEHTLPSIQMSLSKGWPLSKEVVGAIRTFLFEPPLQQKVTELLPLLPQAQRHALQAFFTQLHDQSNDGRINQQTDVTIPSSKSSLASSHNEIQGANVLRSFFQLLGIGNEKELVANLSGLEKAVQPQNQQAQHNMKLHLQQLLNDSTLSTQAKERVEALVSHITGQQLFMSMEGNQGLFHQLLFQFSFPVNQQLDTIYGQIEGRKNKKGQIDPENCRLIFYLQLSSLGETCVDVHIRSKMVSITIFNENQHIEWLQEAKPELNVALQGLGYSLSSMSWQEVSHSPVQGKDQSQGAPQRNPYSLRQQYKGVDIRI